MADAQGTVAMAQPPLMASAGALGDELKVAKRSKKEKRKKSKKDKSSSGGSKKSKLSPLIAPPAYDEAPLSEKSNLAGRVDYYLRSPLGVKRRDIKLAKPYHQVNLTTEPFITFSIQANKNEFIRFNTDSLSLVYYGTWANPNRDRAVAADLEEGAERWALRAQKLKPLMFVDPSVMGAGFFHRVEVSVDNVPCLSNSDLNSMQLHYTRASRVFTDKPPGPYFKTSADFATDDEGRLSKAMNAGAAPFDAAEWSSSDGHRMTVPLDGFFPFNLKNRTLESIDKRQDPNLYFPPDTTITVKLHAHRTKMEAVFHPEVAGNIGEYFDKDATVGSIDKYGIRFTILEALLEYESVQLHPLDHANIMQAFRNGGTATYNYDRVSCQHSALMPGVSMTENRFQIPPYARLIYVFFLPDYATFTIDATRRPLSGLTRFPAGCTNMSVSFAGEEHLIHDRLENFGIAGKQVEASKRVYWASLKKNRMLAASFDELFPKRSTDFSVIQALVLNMRNMVSKKIETLSVRTEFATAAASPERQQVVVMSVHPNGTLKCQLENQTGRWNWEFGARQFD